MARLWTVGERVPPFHARTQSREKFHFDTVAGRYIILSLLGTLSNEKNVAAYNHMLKRKEQIDAHNLAMFAVSVDMEDHKQQRLKDIAPGIQIFWDLDHRVSTLLGAMEGPVRAGEVISYSPFTLILDPNLRTIAIIPLKNAEEHNAAFDRALDSIKPVNDYAGVPVHAPVLIVPRVFEPEFCRMLIDTYHREGGEDSGFMREEGGKTVGVYDHSFKKRKDHFIKEDTDLIRQIQGRYVRRLFPEIKRAFDFNVSRMERYVISCYESEGGGFFRPHRDNTTPATLHRRFACSLNLNADEYEGGDLRFPEFGRHTYRAPTGGAVIFSCSLLHEATPVTKGTRYAFLPFLYDDAAAKLRKENQHLLSEEIIDTRETGAY